MSASGSEVRRNWPIIVAIIATGVIAYQVARVKHWLPWGELNKKDPTVGPVWTGSGGTGPKIAKGWVGWAISDAKDGQGCHVVEVYEGGPAWQAGIRADDVIETVGGEPATQEKLANIIQTHSPGYDLDLQIRHADLQTELVTLTIGQKQGIDSLCMRTIAVACSGLAALQNPEGLWPHYLPNPNDHPDLRTSVGVSALACAALALAGENAGDDGKAALEKGLPVLLKMIGKDGGLDPRDGIPHRVYANSFLLLALAQSPQKYAAEIASVRDWLARAQIGGSAGWDWVDPLDPRYGGWSYHSVATGRMLRADVSVASWALDALAAAGLPSDRVEWSRASRFLERLQNLEIQSKDLETQLAEKPYRDGGFAFTPRFSKAGRAVVGPELEVYRSYGSATADGLRGLIAASGDVPDLDGREAAVQWLARNYTLAKNPGFGDPDPSGWSSGVYFYWLASLARALNAAKVDKIDRGNNDVHAWPDELARLLANFSTFYKKHVFASPNGQMHEDSPATSTAFAVIALCAARDRVRAGDGHVLLAKPMAPPPPRQAWAQANLALADRGRIAFQETGCIGCHNDKDPTNGPPLMGVADRFLAWHRTEDAARAYLRKHIRNAKEFPGTQAGHYPGKEMFPFDSKLLPDDKLDAIVEFLLTREGALPVSEAH